MIELWSGGREKIMPLPVSGNIKGRKTGELHEQRNLFRRKGKEKEAVHRVF